MQMVLVADPSIGRRIIKEHVVAGMGVCWVWQGSTTKGYGQIVRGRKCDGQKKTYVHRLMYELFVGQIPDGYEIHHRCRVTRCCNPDHLEPRRPEHNWANQYTDHA